MSTTDEQRHHYFASTAFNWAVAPTRREAITKVARMAGADTIKRQEKHNGKGLYVWSCRVETPQSQNYSINNYAPSTLTSEDGTATTVRVPISGVMVASIVNTKGAVVLDD